MQKGPGAGRELLARVAARRGKSHSRRDVFQGRGGRGVGKEEGQAQDPWGDRSGCGALRGDRRRARGRSAVVRRGAKTGGRERLTRETFPCFT